ncbi:hypothetical protein [Rhodococcus koreensis]|uniref:hypothetical protein n=1 Tax=Rhodococcus koreensis TaxID=99653 RepID=UPI0036DB31A9
MGDFVDERARIVVEVDGREFHSEPDVFRGDRRRQNWLVREGWMGSASRPTTCWPIPMRSPTRSSPPCVDDVAVGAGSELSRHSLPAAGCFGPERAKSGG